MNRQMHSVSIASVMSADFGSWLKLYIEDTNFHYIIFYSSNVP